MINFAILHPACFYLAMEDGFKGFNYNSLCIKHTSIYLNNLISQWNTQNKVRYRVYCWCWELKVSSDMMTPESV